MLDRLQIRERERERERKEERKKEEKKGTSLWGCHRMRVIVAKTGGKRGTLDAKTYIYLYIHIYMYVAFRNAKKTTTTTTTTTKEPSLVEIRFSTLLFPLFILLEIFSRHSVLYHTCVLYIYIYIYIHIYVYITQFIHA